MHLGVWGSAVSFPSQSRAEPGHKCNVAHMFWKRVLRDAFMRLCQKVVVFGHILGRGNRVAVTGEKGNWNEKCQ